MIEAGKVNVTAQGLQALEQVARANGTQDVFAAVLKASAEIDRLTRELAEARAERDAILQAITDPENQPSQYGTVTLAMYEKAAAERDALAKALLDCDRARGGAYMCDQVDNTGQAYQSQALADLLAQIEEGRNNG